VSVPIEGRLDPERATVAVGATVRYRLELSATVPFKEVAVRVKIPAGMALAGGVAQSRIVDFVPGRTRVFEVALRLDASGEKEVWFETEVVGLGADAALRRVFLGVVNPVDRGGEQAPTIIQDRQGNRYQVQGIPRSSSP
jgi:hypothetical protein